MLGRLCEVAGSWNVAGTEWLDGRELIIYNQQERSFSDVIHVHSKIRDSCGPLASFSTLVIISAWQFRIHHADRNSPCKSAVKVGGKGGGSVNVLQPQLTLNRSTD